MRISFVAITIATFRSGVFAFTGTAFHRPATSVALSATVEEKVSKTRVPVFDEVCDTTGVTLKRFMSEVALLNPELTELTVLFGGVDTACKALANLVKRSQLPSSETLGYEGNVNVQGEDQKKLDVIANDVLKRALRFTGRLGVLASEEEDTPVDIMPENAKKSEIVIDESEKYVAVFDPLDGSSMLMLDAQLVPLLGYTSTTKTVLLTRTASEMNAQSRRLLVWPTHYSPEPILWPPRTASIHPLPF